MWAITLVFFVYSTQLGYIFLLPFAANELHGMSIDRACELILACQGRVVVTGMGKSGHIAGKLAATLASTGTPAFFVHPGDYQ